MADGFMRSWFGDLVMVLSVWAIWYHLLGGLRHLIWDTGRGMDLKSAYAMGYVMIGGSLVLTLFTIIVL